MERFTVVLMGLVSLILVACSCGKVATKDTGMDEFFQRHGAISWYELMTSDVEAAKAFYSKLFGWTTYDDASAGMPYTMFKVGGKDVGGIMSMPPGNRSYPPSWGAYVTVKDVDATAKKIIAVGGKALSDAMDIETVGRIQPVQDGR